MANDCSSFSIGKDGHQRPLRRPEGRPDLTIRQKAKLARHNRMAQFSAAVIRVCHAVNVDFFLETPAPRHDKGSPAHWDEYEEHASLLDLQCMQDCIADLGLVVIIVAQCMLGGKYQKYTALLMLTHANRMLTSPMDMTSKAGHMRRWQPHTLRR